MNAEVAIDNIANVATTIHVKSQHFMNIHGKPQWIMAASSEDLLGVQTRLRKIATKHELLATALAFLAIALTVLLVWLITLNLPPLPMPSSAHAAMIPLILGALIFLPLWAGFQGFRRRHRRVGEIANERWAETIVEIAIRAPESTPT